MPVLSPASSLSSALLEREFGPFFGTPCGILAPLYGELETAASLKTVAREDNAVGVAAGAAMTGDSPVVLMQNSGLGQSVNAIASLIVPYQIPILLIVSMRGVAPDTTTENLVMGRLTEPLLNEAGIPTRHLGAEDVADAVSWAESLVVERRRPAALLISPELFGWRV
jgi:sulfopyruvate decarboxylase alpha subunit